MTVHFAVHQSDKIGLANLIKRGIDLNYVTTDDKTPLIHSIELDDIEVAIMLIEGGADVSIGEDNYIGRQPIHLASCSGHYDVVHSIILRSGSSVNAVDGRGLTPLHWASQSAHMHIINYLLDNGAHINVRDDFGKTPLHRGSENQHFEITRYLIENGAIINSRDNFGWTALHHAVVCGNVSMVNLLLSYGADVKSSDIRGDSILHLAASRLRKENLKVVSQSDGNMLPNMNMVTPLVFQALKNIGTELSLSALLVNYGAIINNKNPQKETPFLFAAEEGSLDLMRFFVAAGADLQQENWIHMGKWPSSISDNEDVKRWLSEMASICVQPLTTICKYDIRRMLSGRICEGLTKLPLPSALQKFLHVPDIDDMLGV